MHGAFDLCWTVKVWDRVIAALMLLFGKRTMEEVERCLVARPLAEMRAA